MYFMNSLLFHRLIVLLDLLRVPIMEFGMVFNTLNVSQAEENLCLYLLLNLVRLIHDLLLILFSRMFYKYLQNYSLLFSYIAATNSLDKTHSNAKTPVLSSISKKVQNPHNLKVGSAIQQSDPPSYGVIKWIGELSGIDGIQAGVEMVSHKGVYKLYKCRLLLLNSLFPVTARINSLAPHQFIM